MDRVGLMRKFHCNGYLFAQHIFLWLLLKQPAQKTISMRDFTGITDGKDVAMEQVKLLHSFLETKRIKKRVVVYSFSSSAWLNILMVCTCYQCHYNLWFLFLILQWTTYFFTVYVWVCTGSCRNH